MPPSTTPQPARAHAAAPSRCARSCRCRHAPDPVEGASQLAAEEGVAAVFRSEFGRAVALLARSLGEVGAAEDAVAEAYATALRRWPRDGIPDNPAGWIVTVARNHAIDQLRR